MARVSYMTKEKAAPEIRQMFQKMEDNGFPIINLYKVVAHCPKVGQYFLRLGNSILFKGAVPTNLRELAILRVGQLLKASYEYTHHVPIALRLGVRQEQIDALAHWENSGEFNAREAAVLRYTDEVTENVRVKDETFAGVRGFLSEEGVVELTATIGFYCMACRILEALQVDLE